jgi:hypothetical protein
LAQLRARTSEFDPIRTSAAAKEILSGQGEIFPKIVEPNDRLRGTTIVPYKFDDRFDRQMSLALRESSPKATNRTCSKQA